MEKRLTGSTAARPDDRPARFLPGRVTGCYVVEPDRRMDERGHFARMWCAAEFAARGLCARVAQINVGASPRAGTLRGLHYQLAPHAEVKIVRCTRGSVFDVAVDLRPASPTFRQWHAEELSAGNGWLLYVPEGCAHGYLTLTDDSEVLYLTSEPYAPDAARGVRYDDPAFAISWPRPIVAISAADRAWPDFKVAPA